MSVKTPADLVNEFAKDLIKPEAPKPEEMHEAARQDSPAKAAFVDEAVKDLKYGGARPEAVVENADDLKNAFAASVCGGGAAAPSEGKTKEISEKTEEVITEFKREAEEESTAMLGKLLRGLK